MALDKNLLEILVCPESKQPVQVAEEAVIAKVDENWRPQRNTARSVGVDAICMGYGLVSSTELTMLAECEHQYDQGMGGYIHLRKANMELQ